MTHRSFVVLLCAVSAACTSKEPVPLGDSGAGPGTGPDPTLPDVLSSTPCDACGGDCVVEELAYAGAPHVPTPIDYADLPPAGGPHNPCWAAFGAHSEPVEDDRWVHNLEHGAVVYLHDCGTAGCPDEEAELAGLAPGRPFVLVTPYPAPSGAGMERPFAAVAWEVRMLAGCVDVDAFAAFHDQHVDRAPESVASGPPADCN